MEVDGEDVKESLVVRLAMAWRGHGRLPMVWLGRGEVPMVWHVEELVEDSEMVLLLMVLSCWSWRTGLNIL